MQTLEVRKLGYEPVTQSVKLEAGATTQVAVTLDTIITQLARVNVIVAAMRNAFQEHRRMGLGHFITQKQIEARHAAQFTDVLQTIPTLGLVYASNGRRVIPVRGMTRANGGGCVALAIDGSAVSRDVTSRAGGFDLAVQPTDVAAVEIYATVTLPAQFSQLMGPCGALVLVWTKLMLPSQ